MNAAQQILQTFRQHDIDTVFGYPGGCIMPLYDALVDDRHIQHVLCRHEQACALAADGYARSSGRVGVCIATSGPGATNLITGVANAHRDSVPLVVITGQTPSALMGTDAFQEVDVLGMTLDIVKHSVLVTDPRQVAATIDEALHLAAAGRPGPVWIDIPKDIQMAEAPAASVMPRMPRMPHTASADSAANTATPQAIDAVMHRLRHAKRPLIYSGGGICKAEAETAFRTFVECAGLPCVNTLNGIGNAGRHAAGQLGMLGMHGSQAANRAVDACDLLLVIGARFDDRATGRLDGFAPNATVIHIDIDAAEFHKRRRADLAIRGDLIPTLAALTDAIGGRPLAIDAWRRQCRIWQHTVGFARPTMGSFDSPISGPALVDALSQATPDDAIVACDVGQHQMWVAQYFGFDAPRHHLSSGGFGTMGYGLPAAIGAQLAHPERLVINGAGDGSFMMNVQELATIRRYRLPVKIVVFDNACLGMVRQQQELFYDNRESQIDLDDNPDFAALAAAFDIPSLHIRRCGEIPTGLRAFLAAPGPCLLHAAITREDNVWPIVSPGAANLDMLDGHDQSPRLANAQPLANA